jgi:hypothetical protein
MVLIGITSAPGWRQGQAHAAVPVVGPSSYREVLQRIHVLNRVPLPNKGRGYGHYLSALYELTLQKCFEVRFSEASKKLIEHLNNYGRFRYLEIP